MYLVSIYTAKGEKMPGSQIAHLVPMIPSLDRTMKLGTSVT